MDEQEDIADRLDMACIASCGCITKTPDSSQHEPECLYRLLNEAINEILKLRSRVAELERG